MNCKKCGTTEPQDFWPSMTYQCKDCARAYRARPEVKKRKRDQQLMYQYGITREEYNAMLQGQSHKCAICADHLETPYVDHCHAHGHVRGLLCNGCNVGLGHFRDNPVLLESAIKYLTGED